MFDKNYGEYTEEAVAVALKTIQDICALNKDSCGCSSKCPFLELWDGELGKYVLSSIIVLLIGN